MSSDKDLKLELYHDVLARKVYDRASREDKLRMQIERLLGDKFRFYSEEQGGLLTADEISLVRTYLDAEGLTPELHAYLDASSEALEKEEKRKFNRLRNLLLLAVVVAAGIAVLAIWALNQRQRAVDNEQKATTLAETERATAAREREAKDQTIQLNKLLGLSNDSLGIAQRIAVANAELAQRNANTARAAQLLAQNERDASDRRATAYRLLVVAVEQRKKGRLIEAFQIARRANDIAPDAAVQNFMHDTYSEMPDEAHILRRFSTGEALRAVAFSSLVERLIAVPENEDSPVTVWDWSEGRQLTKLPVRGVAAAALTPDGKTAVTAAGTSIAVWNAETGASTGAIAERRPVKSVDISPDSRYIAATGDDGALRLWPTNGSGAPIQLDHPTWLRRAIFSPDGRYALTVLTNDALWLWELASRRVVARLQHQAPVNAVAFTADSREIITASNDEKMRRWDLRGQLLHTYTHARAPERTDYVQAAAISADGRWLLSATDAPLVRTWSRAGVPLADYPAAAEVAGLAFAPDDRRFAVALTNGDVLLRRAYAEQVATFRPVDLPEIDRLGYEMPYRYWQAASEPKQQLTYARHFAAKSDNFKEDADHLNVLTKATSLFERIAPPPALNARDRDSIAGWYDALAWYQLLAGRAGEAEKSARRGLIIKPSADRIQTNLALALVQQARLQEALPIYRRLQKQPFNDYPGDRRSFRDVFLDDLNTLEKRGLRRGDFDAVRRELSRK